MLFEHKSKIIRVLNTNAVLVKERKGQEVILLGAGIGFKQKPGGIVDESKIEKQFVLEDKQQQSRFQKLLNDIPQEYILVAEQIITLGQNMLSVKLNESIHISLADHIHTAVENQKMGVQIPNNLLLDIRSCYTSEYEVACHGLDMVETSLGTRLPEDEAGFIAMHFVNAEYGGENTNVKKVITFVNEINQFVLKELQITPDESSLSYYRYMTHLKFFAQRVMKEEHYDDGVDLLLETLLPRYQREYACCQKVAAYIREHYQYEANSSEQIYLTVHLAHLTGGKTQL